MGLYKYNVSKLGWGVKAWADNADAGGGVQNQGKLADVILEHSLIRRGQGGVCKSKPPSPIFPHFRPSIPIFPISLSSLVYSIWNPPSKKQDDIILEHR